MTEDQDDKWKKPTIKYLRIVSAVLCIIIIALLITGIFTDWRDVHNIRVSSDLLTPIQRKLLNALNIKIPANESVWNTTEGSEDGIIVQYGIIKNCNFQSETYRNCEVPKNVGFVRDTAVVVLFCVAAGFSIINFILLIVSIYYPNAGWVILFTHLIALICTFAGCVTYNGYKDTAYIYHEHYSTVSFPLKMTYNAGIYVTYVSFYLIVISSLISTVAFCLSPPLPQHQQQS